MTVRTWVGALVSAVAVVGVGCGWDVEPGARAWAEAIDDEARADA